MPKEVDKFTVFSKKFIKLDNEGQDRLVKTAQKLLKAHRGMKATPTLPLPEDTINTQVVPNGFNNETGKIC
jgi:hypothetical protein